MLFFQVFIDVKYYAQAFETIKTILKRNCVKIIKQLKKQRFIIFVVNFTKNMNRLVKNEEIKSKDLFTIRISTGTKRPRPVQDRHRQAQDCPKRVLLN